MKVLMTADAVGGVWTYALELCQALANHDVRIVLATMGPLPNEAQRRQALSIPSVSLRTSPYKLEWMQDPWTDVERAGAWLRELAEQQDCDLVHLNGYAHAALEWDKPVVLVAHSCVYSWWQAVHGELPPSSWETYRKKVQAGLQNATMVVAPSVAFLDSLHCHYSFSTTCRVIHNARSVNRGADDFQKQPIVFACGRLWDEAKGMEILDEAARGLPWNVEVIGETRSPDGRSFCPRHLRALGTRDSNEVAERMGRAAIFAHPARYEPFGLAVLEAAHAGCALVLSDIPSLRELWDGAALFVDASDSMELHRALLSLIKDTAWRLALSERARTQAQQFSTGIMAQDYLALYRMLSTSSVTERSVA